MFAWFASLDAAGIVFACIAIPSTLLLLIQIVMTFIGLGGDDDVLDMPDDGVLDDVIAGDDVSDMVDGDFNADIQFHFFTFRGIVAMLVTFGWLGLTLYSLGDMKLWAAILISAVAGIAVMGLVALILNLLFRLQDDGTMHVRNAVGACGTVYLTIPPKRTATGKVTVMIQGVSREVEAVTDSEEPLKTGVEVTVVGIRGGDTLVVIPR